MSAAAKKPGRKPRGAARRPAGAEDPAAVDEAARPLTQKEALFVEEYLVDLNGSAAAIRAGYSARSSRTIAAQILAKRNVQVALKAAIEARVQRTNLSADRVLRDLWAVATADPRELMQVKLGCCRYCYGESFGYQRTVGEMNRAKEQFLLGQTAADFDELGGIGFDPRKQPNPDCPACGGDGQARVALADTRELPPKAAALFAGAKQTRHGIEILTHSQTDARDRLARHLGLYKDRVEHSGPDGGPIPVATATPLDFAAIRAKRQKQGQAGG